MKSVDPIVWLRRQAVEAGSQRNAAKRLAISEQYLSDMLHGRRHISDAVLGKLGLRRTVIADQKAS